LPKSASDSPSLAPSRKLDRDLQIPPEAQVVIDFDDNRAVSALVGPYGQNLALIERRLGVVVDSRGNHITIAGSRDGCDAARPQHVDLILGQCSAMTLLKRRHQAVMQRGDTLGSVLARLGIDDAAAQSFLRTDARARALYQLRPGKAVRVQADDEGRLIALSYLAQGGELLSVKRIGDGFSAESGPPATAVRLELRSGEITSSLFATSDAVGLPDAVTMQLAEIFSGDVDFHHDLRRGDWFTVVYETRELDGQPGGTGRIVAAEVVFADQGRGAQRQEVVEQPQSSEHGPEPGAPKEVG